VASSSSSSLASLVLGFLTVFGLITVGIVGRSFWHPHSLWPLLVLGILFVFGSKVFGGCTQFLASSSSLPSLVSGILIVFGSMVIGGCSVWHPHCLCPLRSFGAPLAAWIILSHVIYCIVLVKLFWAAIGWVTLALIIIIFFFFVVFGLTGRLASSLSLA